jgi:hypothetical protein
MSENLKTGILIVVAVLTLGNTIVLLTSDDGVSYEKTAINNAASSNAAANTAPIELSSNNNDAMVIEADLGPTTSIQFEEMEHDFGTIDQNTTNPKTFVFTNTGSEPLIISDAKGSCGCTVPQYPREPIAPGETGEIQVVYSPGKQINQQTKSVTITANTEPKTTVLRIKANVVASEESAGDAQPGS